MDLPSMDISYKWNHTLGGVGAGGYAHRALLLPWMRISLPEHGLLGEERLMSLSEENSLGLSLKGFC